MSRRPSRCRRGVRRSVNGFGGTRTLRGFAGRLLEPAVAPDPERDAVPRSHRFDAPGSGPARSTRRATGADAFRRVLMPNVRDIMWRVAGATLEHRRQLGPESRDALRVLEVSPDLLGPLALRANRGSALSRPFVLPGPSAVGGRSAASAWPRSWRWSPGSATMTLTTRHLTSRVRTSWPRGWSPPTGALTSASTPRSR